MKPFFQISFNAGSVGTLAILICIALVTQSFGDEQGDSEKSETDSVEQKAEPRPVKPEDYGQWENLRGWNTQLSSDGRWLAYEIQRVNEENELRLRMLATDSKEIFKYGSRAVFSQDSQWLAYSIGISPDKREQLQKEKKPLRNKLGLHNLVSGKITEFEDVQAFEFSDDGKFLVMRIYPASEDKEKDDSEKGNDIVVRNLSAEVDTAFGNVRAFQWNDEISLLAMIIHTKNKTGNGIQLFRPAASSLQTLESSETTYRHLSWRKDEDDLVVLRKASDNDSSEDEKKEDKAGNDKEEDADAHYEIITWRGLHTEEPRKKSFDPVAHDQFPGATHRLVDFAKVKWAEEQKVVFFGIKEWENKPKHLELTVDEDENAVDDQSESSEPENTGDAETQSQKDADKQPAKHDETLESDSDQNKEDQDANTPDNDSNKDKKKAESLKDSLKESAEVEVWHAKDIEIIPRQKKTQERDRNKSYLAAWYVKDDRFVQLGNELVEDIELLEKERHALGIDNTPYETEKRFGPTLSDVYLVDIETGERKKILEKNKFRFKSSPDGNLFPYIRNGHFWTYDIKADEHRNLTESVDAHFIDQETVTLTDEMWPYGFAAWTDDSRHLIIYDRFDIWMIAANGSDTKRLTTGAKNNIQHRRIVFDPEEDEFVDPDKPMYVSLYGDRTKKYGIGRLISDESLERLIWADKNIASLKKAEDVDVYAYVEQAADDSPDIFVGGADLDDVRQVTETNPFQKDFLWGHSELVDYENEHGEELQGALFYPADYQEGQQYPMIVYIYELRSQSLHTYYTPSERRAYNTAVFTSNGYFVFQPDIVYREQNPGLSAKECIIPAVNRVLESGMIDPDRVGLVGHSWGGYQTAFMATQTDLFAALVAGAPLINMMSMSMSIYWNSGQTDAWIFHESQGRMDRPFWQDVDTYIQNSPIFNIDRLTKPLLIAFGDNDGAVDFNQGVEMYNAARLVQKPVVMLVYPGENHGLRKKPNQVDYHYRILAWFGHYLKGDPAPEWITDGQSYLDRQKEIKDFEKRRKEKKKDKK